MVGPDGAGNQHAPAGGRLLVDEPAPGVARLTISNPQRRGALDHPILDAFTSTLPQLDARCVVITGEGDTFSAGYDLGALPQEPLSAEADRLVANPFTGALDALEGYPYPTLAALNGHAIGGGLELALTCDLRIAAAGAYMRMPPAKLSLVYSHTGIQKFIDAIGAPRTRELFLLGRRIDAATARAWGLVNAVTDDESVGEEALVLAAEMASAAPLAQRGNKRVIRELLSARGALDRSTEQDLLELRRASLSSEDFREAVNAFAEKREPRWHGR
jgi:enoyl-CoA hydratase/carnithine racemase